MHLSRHEGQGQRLDEMIFGKSCWLAAKSPKSLLFHKPRIDSYDWIKIFSTLPSYGHASPYRCCSNLVRIIPGNSKEALSKLVRLVLALSRRFERVKWNIIYVYSVALAPPIRTGKKRIVFLSAINVCVLIRG